jgi:gliding motility-associated-like protein
MGQWFDFQLRVSQLTCLLLLCLGVNQTSAQQVLISNGTQSVCAGQFLDDSGTTGSYSNSNYQFTLCSSTPGQAISLLFQGVSIAMDANNPANSDYLSIYDGTGVSTATLIGTYTGTALQGQTIQASFQNTSGCLTFVFQNGSVPNGAGWEAQISCYNPCNKPVAVVNTPGLQPAPAGHGVMACMEEPVNFNAQASTTPTGTTLATYSWNFGDGSPIVVTSTPTVEHAYEAPGQYLVHLMVTNNTGCSSTNQTQYKVMVSTRPTYPGLSSIDQGPHLTCSDFSALSFDGGAVNQHGWQAVPPMVVSQPLYLADLVNVQFISTLHLEDFPAGSTVSSCSDLVHVYANMEHAFVGDLDIWVKCPNGATAQLTQAGAAYASLGEPFAGDSPQPGVGWDYYWSPTATGGTFLDVAPSIPPSTPFSLPSGIYEAEGNLCNLVGCPLNGDWSIHIVDNISGSNGYLFSWGLEFSQQALVSLPTFQPTTVSTYWTGPFLDPNQQGAVFSVNNPNAGTYNYSYHVVTDYGCDFDSTITITFHDPAVITAGPDKNFSCTPVMLEAGFETSSPYTYTWSWSPTNGLDNPNISNPNVVALGQTTTYTVTVTPIGFPACAQTDQVVVNVVPSAVVSLDPAFHGCAGTPITLPAPSVSGGVPPIQIYWEAPDGQVINQPSIQVVPTGADVYCAVVTDGCNDPQRICTMVSTPPAVNPNFSLADNAGCTPFSTLFTADYTEVQNLNKMVWHFGDGQEAEVMSSANYVYQTPGIYYPWIEIEDIYGCTYRDTSDNPVLAWARPKVDFRFLPEEPIVPNTHLEFFNETDGGLTYQWDFAGLGQSVSEDTMFTFPIKSGIYPTTLVAVNQYGCADSLTKEIFIKDELLFYIPNAFTPDGDGYNDVWFPYGTGYHHDSYHLRIFNRWGDVVFETRDNRAGWVGESSVGEYYFVPDGIYTYLIEVRDLRDDVMHQIKGSIMVFR